MGVPVACRTAAAGAVHPLCWWGGAASTEPLYGQRLNLVHVFRAIPSILIVLAGCAGMVPADDDSFSGDHVGSGHTSVAAFPNVALEGSPESDGIIEMEHVGGDCIIMADYTFRVEGGEVTPRTSATADTPAQDFCDGDDIFFDGWEEQVNEIVVIDKSAQTQVFKRYLQL